MSKKLSMRDMFKKVTLIVLATIIMSTSLFGCADNKSKDVSKDENNEVKKVDEENTDQIRVEEKNKNLRNIERLIKRIRNYKIKNEVYEDISSNYQRRRKK